MGNPNPVCISRLQSLLFSVMPTLCRFYFQVSYLRKSAQPFLDPALQARVYRPEYLGKFFDKDGYNGKPPGKATLQAAWKVVSAEREPWLQRRAQMVGGKILAGDGSFKFTKKVKVDGNRVYQGTYTVMNEHHMVVKQVSRQRCDYCLQCT